MDAPRTSGSAPAATDAASRLDLAAALKDAGLAALVTLGLCIPIIAYKTDQSIANELVLVPRWGLVGALCAAAFAVRFAVRLAGARRWGPPRAGARKEAITTVVGAPPTLA